ncbi:hypothetical protein O9Z70_14505 [Devosia sp. YIM 151766]|uniref:hypothetical protein n=1 Tax=Devosia sp. YIM 151766 TaxID=3017325 RepID=UPI00255CE30B|nr:hypothetical protein [Devosia sp. YIM 151766]WIY52648.1 hypothetical protein O9Z70_14505 [Devosia sp. YIM 151766]
MAAISDLTFEAGGRQAEMVDWQGRSGRHYLLSSENLASFVMRETALYLLAKGRQVLWVGSAGDLVTDPASRARFRLALRGASRAFRLDAPMDRLAAIWDLEAAMPAPLGAAQAA